MASIYISSTFSDLEAHRSAAIRVLRRMGHAVVGMEDYAAADDRPLDRCLDDVAATDIYVGVFAWRYGHVPKTNNQLERSITELEYRHAKENRIPRLIFLSDHSAAWPVNDIDALGDQESSAEALRRLRGELEADRLTAYFSSPDSLANEVAAAVGFHLQADDWLADAVMTETEAAGMGRFSPAGVEAALNEMRLGSSLYPELEENLRQIVQNLGQYDYAVVNVGKGRSWWSTRLFLLAALASDCTDLDHLVFVAGRRYVGNASTRDTHLRLAEQYPDYEEAYRRSRPPAGGLDQQDAIVETIRGFSVQLGIQFPAKNGNTDERKIKKWMTEASLRRILGASLTADAVDSPQERATLLDVYDILAKEAAQVAFIRSGVFESLVDREAIASRVARAAIRRRMGQHLH